MEEDKGVIKENKIIKESKVVKENKGIMIFPCNIPGTYCDEYNCLGRAEHFIGTVGGPINKRHKLCSKHKDQLIKSIMGDLGESIRSEIKAEVREDMETELRKEIEAEYKLYAIMEKGVADTGPEETEKADKAEDTAVKISKGNKLVCQYCGKDYFKNKGALISHERNCYEHPSRKKARE